MNSPIAYSAIKSGIIAITRYLAKLYGKKNIQINCISPGGIKENQSKVFVKRYKKSCLSKGLLESDDLFPLVYFLFSENSKFINGQNIILDDGWSL
jgi:NAD(P)-dependent dehydrogenase (short-subunit alcohol dehydrogenase family)